MKRVPGFDGGKGNKPDGTPRKGRTGEGNNYGKNASRGSGGYKSGEKSERPSTSGDRPYKSRKTYGESGRESDKADRFKKDTREDRPSRPWKRDHESGESREKRFSDKPSGDRPYKSRKPRGESGRESDKADRFKKDTREDRPSRPWKRDHESGESREKRHSDKPSGDRPYKSRKPHEESGRESDKADRFKKDTREDRPSRPWKRDDDSGESREKRYTDKQSGDRPYKSRKSYESHDEEYKPRVKSRPGDHKPTRPRKPEDLSEAPRERRLRKSESTNKEFSKRSDDGDFRPKRKFQEKGEPGKFHHNKSDKAGKIKGNYGYDKDGTIRLNKFIANSGVCSRREADVLIESGAVSVNGKIVTELGTKITREDKVQFGGETLNIEKKVYLLLNKPKGYITTVDDPQDRNTVMMLVKDACRERIYPVGRLDRNTTGLLLFTNDGEIAKKLTHPGHKVRKVYHVELNKGLAKSDMIRLTEGIELEDGPMAVDEIAYTGSGDDKKNIGLVIHSGRNRVVRRLFEALEYEVVRLDRVAFANLTKKDLPRGRWRMLEQSEINMLLMI